METIIQTYQPADCDAKSLFAKYGCQDEPEK